MAHRLMLHFFQRVPLKQGLRLRIKDVDFGMQMLVVREGKGSKDRTTVLPESLIAPLKLQMDQAMSFESGWVILAR